MAMKTFDENWFKLKQEKQMPVGSEIPKISPEATDWTVTRWFNNPSQMKCQWREGVVKHTAWFELDKHHGMWRQNENRMFEEVQFAFRHSNGIRVSRMTATDENFKPMINIKMLEVQQTEWREDLILDRMYKNINPLTAVLIINGSQKYYADPSKIKGGIKYKFEI